ncbi:MAG: histidine phosphatase family protein [Planctomycetota bacterium]
MRLHLIRHAESENNARPAYERTNDPWLTQRGLLQTEHLARWTETLRIDSLITSPFRRTLQTTQAILAARSQPVAVWHDVFEHGGCFDGHTPDSFRGAAGLNPEQIQNVLKSGNESIDENQIAIDPSIGNEGWWAGKPRESFDQAMARADRVHARLIDAFGGQDITVVLVIHADFIRCLLKVMLPNCVDVDAMPPVRNVSITRMDRNGDRWELQWLGSVTHVPDRLITGQDSVLVS